MHRADEDGVAHSCPMLSCFQAAAALLKAKTPGNLNTMDLLMKNLIRAIMLLALGVPLAAQETQEKAPADLLETVSELRALSGETKRQSGSGEGPPPLYYESSGAAEAAAPAGTLEALELEVQALRRDLRLLQETLDLMVNRIMADLEKENRQLRSEIQRLYALYGDEGLEAPDGSVPRPDARLLQEVLEQPPEELAPAPEEPEPAEFTWSIVEEWGRTPEAAAELGGTSSLKGMVCVVPPGSGAGDLEQLGRDLRTQYGHYDNINIEVFDDEEAARAYAENHVSNPAHRVLSISKHAGSGRDVILRMQDGMTLEVEF